MTKKVYHVHLTAPSHPNNGWEQGFLQNGYEYKQIPYGAWSKTWGEVPTKNKIIGEVELMKPDFVFMQLQAKSFFDQTFVAELKRICPVIVFNEDVRNDNRWMVELQADLFLVSNTEDVMEFCLNRLAAAHMLPTYDETLYYEIPLNAKRYDKYGEIVFIGNQYAKSRSLSFPNSEQRLEMIDFMQSQFGHRFQAYGMGTLNGYLPPEKESEAYRNARIVIGHNNFHRTDYQSDRIMRAVASGAIFVPHFNKISAVDNMWMINGSWSDFGQLGMIVDEYLTTPITANEMRKIQREGVSYHTPQQKILELQRKTKEQL
jgi:hypothetical protein